MYKAEGIRGLYKGFVPSLFGTLHGSLQFVAYEKMKIALQKDSDPTKPQQKLVWPWRFSLNGHSALSQSESSILNNAMHTHTHTHTRCVQSIPQYLLIASSSKIFATCGTYPFQVIRSRLQVCHEKTQACAP